MTPADDFKAQIMDALDLDHSDLNGREHDALDAVVASLRGRVEQAEKEHVSAVALAMEFRRRLEQAEKALAEYEHAAEWEQDQGGCECRTCTLGMDAALERAELDRLTDGMIQGVRAPYFERHNERQAELSSLRGRVEQAEKALREIVSLGPRFDAKGVHSQHVVSLAREALAARAAVSAAPEEQE